MLRDFYFFYNYYCYYYFKFGDADGPDLLHHVWKARKTWFTLFGVVTLRVLCRVTFFFFFWRHLAFSWLVIET